MTGVTKERWVYPTLNFPDTLYFRYGFCPTPDENAPPLSSDERAALTRALTNVPMAPAHVPPSIARDLIRAFLEPSTLPPDLSDLSVSHPNYVQYMDRGVYKVTPLFESYSICARKPKGLNFTLITDASSVLHVIRAEALSMTEALNVFLQNGVAFQILFPHNSRKRSAMTKPMVSLGTKPYGWQPGGLDDYYAYTSARDTLLRHPLVARAALRYGGPAWRLAVQANGPRVLDASWYLSDGDYCDYELTEEDKCLIFGVYKVQNRNAPDPRSDFAEVSWFPKQSAWKTSGLNLGFWCANSEEWYQQFIERILRGDVRLFNQKQWKSAMLMMKRQRKVSLIMREDAEEKLGTELRF